MYKTERIKFLTFVLKLLTKPATRSLRETLQISPKMTDSICLINFLENRLKLFLYYKAVKMRTVESVTDNQLLIV